MSGIKDAHIPDMTLSRKHGSDQSNVKTLGDTLTRSSMRKSSRSKGVTSLVQAMSGVVRQPLLNWGTPADNLGVDERDGGWKSPSGSAGSSPGSSRQNIPDELSLMSLPPPPHDVTTKGGSQPSSRAPSPSSENVNEDNESMRSDTDPGVEEMSVDESTK